MEDGIRELLNVSMSGRGLVLFVCSSQCMIIGKLSCPCLCSPGVYFMDRLAFTVWAWGWMVGVVSGGNTVLPSLALVVMHHGNSHVQVVAAIQDML